MSRTKLLKLARLTTRSTCASSTKRSFIPAQRCLSKPSIITQLPRLNGFLTSKPFSTSVSASKGISPESSNPQPKEPESHYGAVTEPTEITMEEYHQVSDEYMDALASKLEALQEAREDVDVEFSVCSPPFPTRACRRGL
jgi:frataxin